MRWSGAVVAAAALAACTSPPPPPSLPGSFVGAFQFTATLVLPGEDAGGLPPTTCEVELDAGFGASQIWQDGGSGKWIVTFYAYLSQGPGAVYWQILGGPYEDGGLDGGRFDIDVQSCGPITGCGCVASVNEQIALEQVQPDGGAASALTVPVLQLQGWIEDTLSTEAAACVDAGLGPSACYADAGPGCSLGPDGTCDLVYQVVGTPGLPGS